MLATIEKLQPLLLASGSSQARIDALKTQAAEFDAEVADGQIWNTTATNTKDGLYLVQRAFESVRVYPNETDTIILGNDVAYDLPYSIDGGTAKKAIRILQAALKEPVRAELKTALALQLQVAEAFSACTEELRAVKDKLIKGRKQSKEEQRAKLAAELRKAAAVDSPISKLVAPMKQAAQDDAEAQMRTRAAKIKATLEAAGWDLLKVAPNARTDMGRKEYVQAQAKQAFYLRFVNDVDNRFRSATRFVTWSDEQLERVIARVRDDAGLDFDAYVVKLNEKVGEHTSAVLVGGHSLWSDSTIDVVTAAGKTERWNTKRIINVSVLGTLFNQWPTRQITA